MLLLAFNNPVNVVFNFGFMDTNIIISHKDKKIHFSIEFELKLN